MTPFYWKKIKYINVIVVVIIVAHINLKKCSRPIDNMKAYRESGNGTNYKNDGTE